MSEAAREEAAREEAALEEAALEEEARQRAEEISATQAAAAQAADTGPCPDAEIAQVHRSAVSTTTPTRAPTSGPSCAAAVRAGRRQSWQPQSRRPAAPRTSRTSVGSTAHTTGIAAVHEPQAA
jgi:hypothetical protein